MNKNKRYGYLRTAKESMSIKIGRNNKCPCGKTVDKIYTDEDGRELIIPTPVKYKNCCMGKVLFFRTKEDAELADKIDKRRWN